MAADVEPPDPHAVTWRAYALIALITIVSALFGVATVPVLDRDEARFAQASRQMVETGDYIRIRLQDQDRSKKPVGIYWLQAASAQAFEPITHRLNAIWPYRLPSVLGALMAALATLWAGARLIGPRAALWGAALFAPGLLLGFEGMTAKTDAALCGFTALALAALAHLYMGAKRPRLLALLFWFALAAAILIKGPVAPLVAALTLAALGLWERRWGWMKPLAWWGGPALMLLIVLPWMMAIYQATDGRFFAEAIGRDLGSKVTGGSEGHAGLPGYHLLLLSFLIFPAAFALPAAARLMWGTMRAAPAEGALRGLRFLIAWALPSFVLFELTPTKLPHYPLPLYPALALLCGAGLAAALEHRWRVVKWLGVVLSAAAGAGAIVLIAQAREFVDAEARTMLTIMEITAGALLVLLIIALVRLSRPALPVAMGVICALFFSFCIRQVLLPSAHALQPTVQVVAALNRAGLTDRPLWVVGYGEASIVFATRTDVRIDEARDAGRLVSPGDAVVLERRAAGEFLRELGARHLSFAASDQEASGRNLGNGRQVEFQIGTVEPQP